MTTSPSLSANPPTVEAIAALGQQLSRWLVRTPVLHCPALESSGASRVSAKLEFMQRTATFKPRGALAVILSLDDAQRAAGVTAVSAGNHAIAVAYAAREIGTAAKVVMLQSASPLRVTRCREYGAEVVLAPDAHSAFAMAEDIRRDEGRYLVHPFEGPLTSLGTATLGLEICQQIADFDAILVPIGGGGLCSGIAAAVKQLKPEVRVYGIEPVGADSMRRSFEAGEPMGIDRVDTIADSLGAPYALPYSFGLCQRYVDKLVTVGDSELRAAMGRLFHDMHLAVEPACAATTAALYGPLQDELQGQSVVLVFCGSNIDWQSWQSMADLDTARVA